MAPLIAIKKLDLSLFEKLFVDTNDVLVPAVFLAGFLFFLSRVFFVSMTFF